MASMNAWIVERHDTRRPCIVYDLEGPRKCLFHCWSQESQLVNASPLRSGHPGGVVSETVAILEFEDGHLEKRRISDFHFADGGQFKQWYWKEEKDDAL